jgi:hypothetical protein
MTTQPQHPAKPRPGLCAFPAGYRHTARALPPYGRAGLALPAAVIRPTRTQEPQCRA